MKRIKLIYIPLTLGLIFGGTAQAWPTIAALGFGASEVTGEPGENGGLLNRLAAIYEATKSLAKNTEWLSESIKYVGNSINHVGRPETLQTINDLTNATTKLTTDGVKINTESLKTLTRCGTGAVAALCGIGIITHTALRDDAKNARTKYIAGSCLTALGLTSIWCTTLLNK
ncbi:MAG: hypothetical protein AMXMBFR12_04180 [Candidatus Babeliales bacterium]